MNRTEAAEKQWIDREEADRAQERKWAQQRESAKASQHPPDDRFCERPLICPHCTKLLELRNVNGVEVHGCKACAGGWLEADQLAALMKKRLGWWQRARRALGGRPRGAAPSTSSRGDVR